jgi:endonuclease YncB( thermonuclease family)
VAKVVDGDGLIVGAVPVRIFGIDAPEARQTCTADNGGTWPCGGAAAARLAELVGEDEVTCESIEVDAYNRVVSRCYARGIDVARTLIDEGLAWAFIRYSTDYAGAEATAKAAALGVWQAATQAPWDYREDGWNRAAAEAPAGCPIKGNISRSGERIYHTPRSRWYSRTQINAANGERWFCDEAEAQAAGWRAAKSR